MNDNKDEYWEEIIAVVEQIDEDVSDEPQPMMFGISLKDLLGGKVRSTLDAMSKREKDLMKQIAEEYYQARLLEFAGTQVNTFDFNTKLSKFTAFEFVVRHDEPLHPTVQYRVEQMIVELANKLGYKARLERK